MAVLSERLVQLQSERKLLKKDIAKAAGVSIMGYYRYETGERKPDSDTLIKLADYFGCSIDYLVGRTERDWLAALEEAEDEYLLALALEREKNSNGVWHSLDDITAELGITQEDIDNTEADFE